MREILLLFSQHVERVDSINSLFAKQKHIFPQIDISPSEMYYLNDPKKVLTFATKTNIDIQKFIKRQIVYN